MPPPAPRSSVRNALAYSLSQSVLAFVVTLGTSMVVARLLTPAETGVFALAAAVVAVGNLLREFGLADYLISHQAVTPQRLRAAFTVNLLLAWGLAVALWLLAWPLGAAYGEPGVTQVLHLLCVNFLLVPFGITAFAMLSKEMRFRRIFVLQSCAQIVGAAVIIGAAASGFSSMSMAIGAVASNVLTIGLLLVLQPATVFHRPTLSGLREVLRFGGIVTFTRLLDSSSKHAGDFIVNGLVDFTAGGLWSKASSLIGSFHDFFNAAVSRVATPAFAKTRADDGTLRLREPYLRGTVLVATALWIFFSLLALFAHETVLLLFGPQWLAAVPVVQVMALGSLFSGPVTLAYSALTARRAVREQLHVQLISAPLAVAGLLFGALHSLLAAAALYSLARVLRAALLARAVDRACQISLAEVLGRLGPSAAVVGAAVLIGGLVKLGLATQSLPEWVTLLCGAPLALAAGAAVAVWLRHPAVDEGLRLWRARRRAGQVAAD